MDNRFLVVLGVVILGLGGLFVLTSNKSTAPSGTGGGTVSKHSIGSNAKNVEVIEYADFQCPACGAFYPVTKKLQETYKNDIKWTFRHVPLEQLHPNARAAHRAAEAAGLQGKFFEMHDQLFAEQSAWASLPEPRSVFKKYAEQLGLDIAKYETDYASEAVNSTINADKNESTSKGVTGTPTFFINGKQMSNNDIDSFEKFSAKIDEAIKAASAQ